MSNLFTIAGAVLGAFGSLQSSRAQSQMYQMQAQASEYNAAVARVMGEQALQVSTAQQLSQGRGARQLLGAQRAALVQAGIGTGGSAAAVAEQSQTLAELDQMNLAWEGAMRFASALSEADLQMLNAGMFRKAASDERKTGLIRAGTSLLTGASSVFGATKKPSVTTPADGYRGISYGGGLGLRPGGGVGLRG